MLALRSRMPPRPRILAARSVARYPFLELLERDVVDARGATKQVVTLALRPWCVVAARTSAGEWVLVEQHRFGIDALSLEPAGGIIDDDELPADAARRELLEETGYGVGVLRSLGWLHPNPALGDNRAHLFFVDGVERLGAPSWPDDDITRVVLVDDASLETSLGDGTITHALGVIALMRARAVAHASMPTGGELAR